MANHECLLVARYRGISALEVHYNGMFCAASRETITNNPIRNVFKKQDQGDIGIDKVFTEQ